MARRLVGVAAIAALSTFATTTYAASDVCDAEIAKCYIDGGSKTCDRTKAVCPPCLAEMDGGVFGFITSTKYSCNQLDDDSECPKNTKSCSDTTPSPSPTPTPKKTPKKTPVASDSGSNDDDASGSSSSTPKPSKTKKASSSGSSSGSSSTVKTPTPTPSPTPKPTPSPTPSPSPTTAAPQVSQAASPTNANAATDDKSSGISIGVIAAIIAGGVVVVAVLAFFVYKRRQDDDDSDDDEPRFNPPKSNYNHAATSTAYAAGAAPTTTYSKPASANAPYAMNVQKSQMVTSPGGQHNQTYAIPIAGPIVDYGSPSTVDNSQRSYHVDPPTQGGGGYRLSDPDSISSSEGGRDVWGNTVGSYREKRTHSNVSVEF